MLIKKLRGLLFRLSGPKIDLNANVFGEEVFFRGMFKENTIILAVQRPPDTGTGPFACTGQLEGNGHIFSNAMHGKGTVHFIRLPGFSDGSAFEHNLWVLFYLEKVS